MARNAQRSRSISKPAPIGGLNTKDPINAMPLTDAIALVNWIPQQFGVRCRKGYAEWVINLDGPCQSILTYNPPLAASVERFAVTDAEIYNIDARTDTPVSVFSLSGGTGAGKMYSTMFSNTAGSFLIACAAGGGYYTYDGATWLKRVAGAGPGQVNGVNPDDLVFVASWKRRLWFVERNSTNAWYLDADAIAGPAYKLELGPFTRNGGQLAFITTWTIDAGEGIDDYLVFVFDGGDVLIYKGTDPTTAATFAMQGLYYVGKLPPGRRNFVQYGGDVLILSELGLQPLSYVTRGGSSIYRLSAVDYLSKIQPRLAELVSTFGTFEGFDLYLHAKENLLILDIPPGPYQQNVQYVLETNLNGWCIFNNIPMNCADSSDGKFYFGTEDGRVCIGFTGFFDAVPYDGSDPGQGIEGVIQPAFDYFGTPGINKQFLMVRPTMLSVHRPGVQVDIAVDFNPRYPQGAPIPDTGDVGIWDDPAWNLVEWGGSLNTYNDWISVQGIGFAGAAYFRTQVLGDTFLVGIDYMYEFGGPI